MRKSIAIILAIMLMTAPTFADLGYYTVDMVNQTEAVISGYTGGSDVVIPSTVDGVKVRGIGNEVFQAYGITSLTIENGVKVIGVSAYKENKGITTLELPDSILLVHKYGFADCGITILNLGSGVKTLWDGSFAGNNITELTTPSSLFAIYGDAFRNNQIKTLVLNEGLKSIGESAFEKNNIEVVKIPSSVTSIGKGAFRGNKLKEVHLGSNVKVGDNAFGNTGTQTKITYLVIGSNVELGNNVVNGDNAFKAVYDKYGAGTYRYVSNKWIKI